MTRSASASTPEVVQLVHLCDKDRRALFMLETPNIIIGPCDWCDTTTRLFQYPRADVRLEHLPRADRDWFNAKLDLIARRVASELEAQRALDESNAAAAKAQRDAIVAENDRLYQLAVDERHAIENEPEVAEAATPTSKTTKKGEPA